jgi:hypothetical protein
MIFSEVLLEGVLSFWGEIAHGGVLFCGAVGSLDVLCTLPHSLLLRQNSVMSFWTGFIGPPLLREEVITLLNPSKARKVLGWKPKVDFKSLVRMMVDSDMELAEQERILRDAGHKGRTPEMEQGR